MVHVCLVYTEGVSGRLLASSERCLKRIRTKHLPGHDKRMTKGDLPEIEPSCSDLFGVAGHEGIFTTLAWAAVGPKLLVRVVQVSVKLLRLEGTPPSASPPNWMEALLHGEFCKQVA